jgi:calcineurin-like phosphoesterase family protein
MDIFYTADLHFNHSNIIDYCNRPFSDVTEMNEILLHNWNSIVKEKDLVYVLGDFMFYNNEDIFKKYIKKLHGSIILIKGNHDKDSLNLYKKKGFFKDLRAYEELKIDSKKLCLFHFPIEEWNGKYKGSIHIHGHSHGNSSKMFNRYDVGVDTNNFTPIPHDNLLTLIQKHNEMV